MTQITDNQKFGMIEAISHLVHRDYEGIGDDFKRLDFIPEEVTPCSSYCEGCALRRSCWLVLFCLFQLFECFVFLSHGCTFLLSFSC